MEWYYADANENQLGPVNEDQMKALVNEGKISSKTMIWQDGMEEWATAGNTTLKSLFPSVPTPPPIRPSKPVIPTKIGTSDSFDRDESKVFPQNPPRSAHLNWLNLLGPGLAQVVYGKVWMGVWSIALCTIIEITSNPEIEIISPIQGGVLIIALLIASVVDGIMTARILQRGQPVGKWQFFPR